MPNPDPAGAAIFRRCREALGLSAAEMAAALHVGSGGRLIRFWEAGRSRVPGPAWVALRYMLRERGIAPRGAHRELVAAIDTLLLCHDEAA